MSIAVGLSKDPDAAPRTVQVGGPSGKPGRNTVMQKARKSLIQRMKVRGQAGRKDGVKTDSPSPSPEPGRAQQQKLVGVDDDFPEDESACCTIQ